MILLIVVPASIFVWWYTGDWVAGVAAYGALLATLLVFAVDQPAAGFGRRERGEQEDGPK